MFLCVSCHDLGSFATLRLAGVGPAATAVSRATVADARITFVLPALPYSSPGDYNSAPCNAYAIPKDGQLGQDYLDKNIRVVNNRLSVAGVRLAALLNVIFDETKELPSGLSGPLESE